VTTGPAAAPDEWGCAFYSGRVGQVFIRLPVAFADPPDS
jgi:hypothetical protein